MLAADAAAQAAGLHVGMPVTKAQALAPGLIVMDADPAGDAEALERLALWALQRYAPIVAADPPDGIVIDVTGAAHLHGGEDAMVDGHGRAARRRRHRRPRRDGRQLGRRSCACALRRAPGHRCSAGRKRAGDPRVCRSRALRLPKDMVDGLRVLGFERIGELAATAPRAARAALRSRTRPPPRSGLGTARRADRAGAAAGADRGSPRLRRADRRGGNNGPLHRQACRRSFATRSRRRASAPDGWILLFHRVDNRIEAIRVGTALPVRDAKRLTRLLCDKIETIDPGFGVEIMRLAASVAEPLEAKQTVSSLTEEPEADVSGSDRHARQPRRRGPHSIASPRSTAMCRSAPSHGSRRWRPTRARPGRDHWPRPSRLLPVPEPIDDHGAAARSSAGRLHLARRAPPREARRRSGAHLRRMVEARRRADARCAIISRSRTRRANASGSFARATARTPQPARNAGFCTGCSDERRPAMSSCRCTSHF